MPRQILKSIAIAGASSLLLSGCYAEYLNPDGACAEITTEQHPAMYLDYTGDSGDVYFEVETEGAYESIYAYNATPTSPEFIELTDESGPAVEFFNSLDDDTVALDRWSESYDVAGSDPHIVSLGTDGAAMALALYGMAIPIGVVSVCDDDAYSGSLPTASTDADPENLVEVDLPDADAKVFYPGYDPEAFEVELPGDNALTVDVDASNVEYMSAIVLPWIGQFGDMEDASFPQLWYAAYVGILNAYMANYINDVSVMKDIDVNSNETFMLNPEVVNFDSFSEIVNTGSYATIEDKELLGAVVITLAANSIDDGTLQVRFSYEVAEFGANGTFGAVGATGASYDGPKYADALLKGKPGEEVTLTGTDMLVNSVRIGGQNARIVANTATSLTIEIPAGLAGGNYDVQYTFDGGEVNRQLGAHIIGHSVWTKRLSDTQAKLYAKNVAGAGKVQLMLNGKEVAWVNAVDANDPKLRKANGDHYLVRTVNLKAGKNVLEVWVDGTRERRTVYTR